MRPALVLRSGWAHPVRALREFEGQTLKFEFQGLSLKLRLTRCFGPTQITRSTGNLTGHKGSESHGKDQ